MHEAEDLVSFLEGFIKAQEEVDKLRAQDGDGKRHDEQVKFIRTGCTIDAYDKLRQVAIESMKRASPHGKVVFSRIDDEIEKIIQLYLGYRDGPAKTTQALANRIFGQPAELEPLKDLVRQLKTVTMLYSQVHSDMTATHEKGHTDIAQVVDRYVTLDSAAALVNRQKRTLERWLADDQNAPLPEVQGGGGKPNEWKWSTLKPWLEKKAGRILPHVFPVLR